MTEQFDWPEEMPEGFFKLPGPWVDEFHTVTGHELIFYEGDGKCDPGWSWDDPFIWIGGMPTFEVAYRVLREHVLQEREREKEKKQPPERPWMKRELYKAPEAKLATGLDLNWLANRIDKLEASQ